jgi:glycerate dehydrogenase
MPIKALRIGPFTLATALFTPHPPNSGSPSRRSIASLLPREAPAGALLRPMSPAVECSSTSTVGRPRESQTRRPTNRSIMQGMSWRHYTVQFAPAAAASYNAVKSDVIEDRSARRVLYQSWRSFLGRAAGATILLTSKTPLPADVLAQLPKLRYIGVIGTGYNNVDVEAARRLGVTVTNVPTYGTASVAQFVFALLLELCNNVKLHALAVQAGEWTRSPDWSFCKVPLTELSGKIIGIVGFGRIGRQTARIADAFDMRVIATDVQQIDSPRFSGFRWASFEELLRESDVVSLHAPLSQETRGMIDAKTLRLMKPTAFLINTSRGPLVVEQDLADALNAGRIAGAAVDVLSTEPPPEDNPLLGARNCVVTPHIAWATREARARLLDGAIQNLAAFLGGSPSNVV